MYLEHTKYTIPEKRERKNEGKRGKEREREGKRGKERERKEEGEKEREREKEGQKDGEREEEGERRHNVSSLETSSKMHPPLQQFLKHE